MDFPSDHSNGSGAQVSSSVSGEQRRVGLVYDERMCKHSTPRGESHPENPDRIRAISNKLLSAGISQRCVVFDAKEVEDKYIAEVHTNNHMNLIKTISSKKMASQRNRVGAKYNSIYFNEGSSEAAYLAAGSVLEVAEKVAKGELNSAFAIVRPPGHHAEESEPMGFCLYNNVAIATSFLLNQKELGINKILIVDWDVHHGNGTQKMFWKDSRVLFFSVHRHEFGSFYPAGDDGSYIMMGEGPGAGYNINVPWENGQCGDADYIAAWDYILIPVAREFNPDIILISAGFDAAIGDPLGGCRITPHGYSIMLKKLMEFSRGKIVMALEGGYNLNSLANSVLACVDVLLEDKPIVGSVEVYPFESTWRVIKAVREGLSAFWPILAEKLPEKLTSRVTPRVQIYSSQSDDEYDDGPNTLSEDLQEDVSIPLSELKVSKDAHGADQVTAAASPAWRSELSKIDVWYASFGSNMSESRFCCYIEGGQAEGMRRPCRRAVDKSQAKEVLWKTVPHHLFFGRESTITWGAGGVAFLHPESNDQDKTFMCLYRITLEQFNDVLLQENVPSDTSSPFFDRNALDSIQCEKNISLEALKDGWYHNVVYLGKEKDIPVLATMCTLAHVEGFKSGKIPISAPTNPSTSEDIFASHWSIRNSTLLDKQPVVREYLDEILTPVEVEQTIGWSDAEACSQLDGHLVGLIRSATETRQHLMERGANLEQMSVQNKKPRRDFVDLNNEMKQILVNVEHAHDRNKAFQTLLEEGRASRSVITHERDVLRHQLMDLTAIEGNKSAELVQLQCRFSNLEGRNVALKDEKSVPEAEVEKRQVVLEDRLSTCRAVLEEERDRWFAKRTSFSKTVLRGRRPLWRRRGRS